MCVVCYFRGGGRGTKVYAPAGQLRAPKADGMWNGREDPEARCMRIELRVGG